MHFSFLKKQLLVCVFSPLVSSPAFSQPSITLAPDSVLKAMMLKEKIFALGIGVIENGEIKQTKVLGELKAGVPAPGNTIFQVASLTKPITEITTLRLVSKGLWNLDEPLFHYWTDPDVKADPRHKLLTTRHIITHQTGFMNWRWLHSTGKLTFDFDPGKKTQYSGEGLEYLKKSLENKFKTPFEQIVAQYLFAPDSLNDTRFTWDQTMDESRYAVAHDKDGKPYEIRKNTEASAADLLMTTVQDYAQFGVNVLKKKGLSAGVYEDMISYQAADKKFGLGWELFKNLKNGELALIHSGSDPGVRTIIILLPKSKRGLVIFTNSDNGMNMVLAIIRQSLDIGEELIERAK
ncbi:MAG: serine hydrolase domain-containing protein [Chitinophagaceae bacterium]